MGQGYLIANIDKKEFLHPHHFGEGYKAWEMLYNGRTAKALMLLLTTSNSSGGGDLKTQEDAGTLVGHWAGDRIYMVGDYDTAAPHSPGTKELKFDGLHSEAYFSAEYKDVSFEVLKLLLEEGVIPDEDLLEVHYWLDMLKHHDGPEPKDYATWDAFSKADHVRGVASGKAAKKLLPLVEKKMTVETLKKAKAGKWFQ